MQLQKWSWFHKLVSLACFGGAISVGIANAFFTYAYYLQHLPSWLAIVCSVLVNAIETSIMGIMFSPEHLKLFVGQMTGNAATKITMFISRALLSMMFVVIATQDWYSTYSQIGGTAIISKSGVTAVLVFGTEVGLIIAAVEWGIAASRSHSVGGRTKVSPQSSQAESEATPDYTKMF